MQRFWELNPKYVVYGYLFDHDSRNLSPCAPHISEYCLAVPHIDFNDGDPEIVDPSPGNSDRLKSTFEQVKDLGAGRKEYSLFRDAWWLFNRDLSRAAKNVGISRVPAETYQTNFPVEKKELGSRYLLRTLSRETREHGATLIVVFIPNYLDQKEVQPMPEYIRDELSALGVTLIDMTKDFVFARNAFGYEYLQVPGDGHLSVAGHKLIAQRIAGSIQSDKGLFGRGGVSESGIKPGTN